VGTITQEEMKMKGETEKFDLRIYTPGNKDAHVITSDIPFILPRVGDLIDPHGFEENYQAGKMLKVTKVTHMFLHNNLFLAHQQIRVETEIAA
jgi:hypothetical protein